MIMGINEKCDLCGKKAKTQLFAGDSCYCDDCYDYALDNWPTSDG